MAVTGLVLFGFVLVHMAGNLKLYLGADALNHYGEWLRTVGYPMLPHGLALWIARVVLLACVLLHMLSALQVTLISRAARPVAYEAKEYAIASYASRTMRWGGVILLLFIVWHLLDLTVGSVHPNFLAGKPYENLVASLSNPWVAAFYIVANLFLGLHLYHGLWSFFQSLGWNSQKFNPARQVFAKAFAVVITLGNVSFPLAVLSGIVR
jgi:succinate dehydrogenase / fumarate reductase cytochrome b subunit